MNKSKINNVLVLVFILIILILAIVRVIFQIVEQKDIEEYEQKVIGKIIDIDAGASASFTLKYEYIVNGVLYNGHTGVSYFDCEDGTRGCIGKKFYIYYSSKNPGYSRIYLGKYEKYKTTVEFFK